MTQLAKRFSIKTRKPPGAIGHKVVPYVRLLLGFHFPVEISNPLAMQ